MTDADEEGATARTAAPASDEDAHRRRVVEQFSYAGDHAAIWHAFDRVLPTRGYLNMGYSPWYVPTLVGDSQARLAGLLADGLVARVDDPTGTRLLDVGCGRGGPARQFADAGFAVIGLDLVAYNVALAQETAGERSAFVVGDATALPFADDAFGAATAVDSMVYLPEERRAFEEVARVLEPGGWFADADLLATEDAGPDAVAALADFADAWDMAPPVAPDDYHERLRTAGFTVETIEDVTANSTGRLRRWSGLFLVLADGPSGGPLRRLLRAWGADPDAAIEQVRAAHRALPHLRHEVVYARL